MPVPPGLVIRVAPVTVVVPPLTPCRKPAALLPEVVSVPKVRVPAELFCRLTASVPALTTVLPKSMLAVEVPTRIPCVVLPDTPVLPKATVPATPVSIIPCVPLLVVATLMNFDVASNVPLVRLSAWPVLLSSTSGVVVLPTVSVPKPLPNIFAPEVAPTSTPRTALPAARVMPLPPALVITGRVPLMLGRALLNGARVNGSTLDRLAPPEWPSPNRRSLLARTMPPV